MKTRNLKIKNFAKMMLMTLFFMSFSVTTSAQLLYTSDFETNETIISHTSYQPMYESGNSPTIVQTENGITPRQGSHMMKTYLHRYNSSTTYRTEAVVGTYQNFNNLFIKGEEYWLGVSIYIPADWSMDYGGTKNGKPVEERLGNGIILQFHDRGYLDKSWRNGLPLVVSHSKEGFKISNRDDGCGNRTECDNNTNSSNSIKKIHKIAPMLRGQWNDFVMHLKWSPSADGIIQIWVNGKEELNSKGANYFNEIPDNGYPYFKMGLYQSSYGKGDWSKDIIWNTLERTLYHDELRIAGTNSNYNTVFPGGTLAVQDFETIGILMQPNPITSNEFTIQLPQVISVSKVKIFDIQGKEVYTKEISSSEKEITIQPNLASGIYILKLDTAEKGLVSKKIIVE